MENKFSALELESIYFEFGFRILWISCNEKENKVILYFFWIIVYIFKIQKDFFVQYILNIFYFQVFEMVIKVFFSREDDKVNFNLYYKE